MDKINMINKMRVAENEPIDNSTRAPTNSAGQKSQPSTKVSDWSVREAKDDNVKRQNLRVGFPKSVQLLNALTGGLFKPTIEGGRWLAIRACISGARA